MQDDFQLSLPLVLRACAHTPRGRDRDADERRPGARRYCEIVARIDRLARGSGRSGSSRATALRLCLEFAAHFECYFAIPCTGAVLHTVNLASSPSRSPTSSTPRTGSFRRRLARARARRAGAAAADVEHFVVMVTARSASCAHAPLRGASRRGRRRRLRLPDPERQAAALCYTTARRRSKGVLYSHRSIVLHSVGLLMTDAISLREPIEGCSSYDVPRQRLGWPHGRGAQRDDAPDAGALPPGRAAGTHDRVGEPADGLRATSSRPFALRGRAHPTCARCGWRSARRAMRRARAGLCRAPRVSLLHAWGMTRRARWARSRTSHRPRRDARSGSPRQQACGPARRAGSPMRTDADLPWDGVASGEIGSAALGCRLLFQGCRGQR